MRISYSWLKTIIDLDLTPVETANILTSLGLEVEGIEYIESIQGGLQGVVVGEVLACEKHPNADRLKLTKVNIGSGEPLSIVCGASNVAVGQKVLVATEGTILYPKKGESIVIKKSKIRGEESCGMICAEDELGISDNHDGIMILDSKSIPGTPASEILQLKSEVVFEIGLTPNRSDATSHLGVARDIAAWFRVHKNIRKEISLSTFNIPKPQSIFPIQIDVVREDLCPRYAGICLRNLKVAPSPLWLQDRLKLVDQKPINNVVDITNYILFHYGQPLHAFDLEKIIDHHLIIDTLSNGTTFITLDQQEKKLSSNDLMICDGHRNPLCMGGVMGGINSGVTDNTTSIFLEAAYFMPSTIRKSSMNHLLRSNAAKTFEKGVDPNMVVEALQAATKLLIEICGAEVCSEVVDVYPQIISRPSIDLDLNYVNALSGMSFDEQKLKEVLFALDMEVKDLRNGKFQVYVGTNKHDVTRPADVVEEICRVYGLDHIPIPEKIKISFPTHVESLHGIRQQLSTFFASRGYNEIMGLSLCSSEICLKSGIWKDEELVYINNSSNTNLDVMNPSIALSGLQAIAFNQNRQQNDLALFEIGRSYSKSGNQYKEEQFLSLFLTGAKNSAHWTNSTINNYTFFDVKGQLEELFNFFGCSNLSTEIKENIGIYNYAMTWVSDKNEIASCGIINSELCKQFDIKKEVYHAEINLAGLQKLLSQKRIHYKEVSKFPSSKRDLALVVNKSTYYKDIENIVFEAGGEFIQSVSLFDIYTNDEQLGNDKKSMAISIVIESKEKSLSSAELDQITERIIKQMENRLQASIRR